jgi:EAL domain-containing protein (putative c-di-GMP-specific phosphodiesterase class I)
MADVRGGGPGSGTRGARARRRDWSRRIQGALEGDLFVLHAQRIVDVAGGETLRHELFLRMVEEGRLVPAGEFLQAAEELGSIREIDRWVLGQAIEITASGHSVAVNLGVSADDELLDLIRGKLADTGADPSQLVLELREEQLVPKTDAGEGFVRGAHELGCRIALDAYIEGGRRQGLLKSLPFDLVKLGPSFVDRLAADGRRRRKARNAAGKAHRSGQRVIAQGIEDLITLQLLEGLGIDEAQGYALGRPEPIESAFPTSA